MWIGIAIGLVALAGTVLLARYVAAGGTRLGVPVVLLVVAVCVTFSLTQLLGIYYRIPLPALLVLVVLLGVVGWLFIEVGRGIGWNRPRLLGLVGMLVAATLLATVIAMATPAGNLLVPLFKTRAAQIAEAQEFTLLLPADQEMFTDWLPVEVIETPEPGVSIAYEAFTLAEWKAESPLSEEDMRALLAPGQPAVQPDGFLVTSDAVYESLAVGGAPALGVEFVDEGLDEKGSLGGGTPLIRVLVLARDGVQVRLFSQSRMVFDGITDGQEIYSWQPALSFEELAAIGASLEPLE